MSDNKFNIGDEVFYLASTFTEKTAKKMNILAISRQYGEWWYTDAPLGGNHWKKEGDLSLSKEDLRLKLIAEAEAKHVQELAKINDIFTK